jgi:hypothetical protein
MGLYKRINIEISPQLMIGKLERKNVCQCNYPFVREDTPLGTEYHVDLRSVRWARFKCHGCGKISDIRICDVWDAFGVNWFVIDLLDLDAGIPFRPKPDFWEPIRDNNHVAAMNRLPTARRGLLQ